MEPLFQSAYTANNGALLVDNKETALSAALGRLLRPVARLCLDHGLPFAAAVELLKRSFVHEAKALRPDLPEHGMVSRISTATGINRREVARLTKNRDSAPVVKQPLAAELVARWLTDPSFRGRDNLPCALQRTGSEKSFEALAQLVTRDVHPRSILDELVRLGLVCYDEKLDSVALACADFVPKADLAQMLGFLGDNAGDHLEAAVDNVASGDSRHLEQAVFADELSAESVRALQSQITAHWQALRADMVPAITALIEADKEAGRPQDQRIRIGLYTFAAAAAAAREAPKNCMARRLRNCGAKGKTA